MFRKRRRHEEMVRAITQQTHAINSLTASVDRMGARLDERLSALEGRMADSPVQYSKDGHHG